MPGYRGFKSKEEYENYYSDIKLYGHEIPMMEAYTKEAEEERNYFNERKMIMDTKACSITEEEVEELIAYHGRNIGTPSIIVGELDDRVERINYLHKRLKAFREPEAKVENVKAQGAVPAANVNSGWGNGNG